MINSEKYLAKCIDTKYTPETSIVLRYRNAFKFGMTDEEDLLSKEWLQKTSIQEGARIFFLLIYKDVEIYILDETSLMHTKTLKSIDGCVTIAKCKLKGYDTVVFESGGNTGTALTVYGQRAGVETFLFLPEENISLLDSKIFKADSAHIISIEEPGLVKKAAYLFERLNRLEHIPKTQWRYEASRFRGFFILEYLMEHEGFDWLAQTISAAFGPIGIYFILNKFKSVIKKLPNFLGVQQEANCPMYQAWKSKKTILEPIEIHSTQQLLTKVMYDVKPHTYGTYKDLTEVLVNTQGDLTTVNQADFDDLLEYNFDGKYILDIFEDNGITFSQTNGEVVEKTGLLALTGTLKEIDNQKIAKGSKILCILTSGISEADGKTIPEYKIPSLDGMIDRMMKEYSNTIWKE